MHTLVFQILHEQYMSISDLSMVGQRMRKLLVRSCIISISTLKAVLKIVFIYGFLESVAVFLQQMTHLAIAIV